MLWKPVSDDDGDCLENVVAAARVVDDAVAAGGDSIEKFQLEFWLEFWLDILFTKIKLKN